jgi:hypothetical protein
MPRLLSLIPAFALLVACRGVAGEKAPGLDPAPVTIQGKDLSTKKFLQMLREQTGNEVSGGGAEDTALSWDLRATTFWPAVDELCRRIGCHPSVRHQPLQLSLLDGLEKTPVAYDGIFRISADRVSLVRDFDQDAHLCHVTVQLAWEPRFRPFHMEVGGCSATHTDGKMLQRVEMSGQGKQELTGPGGAAVTYRFPAPAQRAFDRIAALEGTMTVVGPTRLLAFQFDKLAPLGDSAAPRKQTQDKVDVTLKRVSAGPDRWSFTLQIDNAPGVPAFESYQSWLGNNETKLVRGKEEWKADPDNMEILEESAQRAVVRYHFVDPKRIAAAKLADWTLLTTTPHRIVAVPVRFTLKNIALP